MGFVLPWRDDAVMPIEVKSGKTYKRHSALSKLLSMENYSIAEAMVLCEGNVQKEGDILYLPVYMATLLR